MPPKAHVRERAMRKRLPEVTPLSSSVLLMVRTGTMTGSQLVATLHTNIDSTLEEIRMQLVSIAAAAKSGREVVPAKLPPKTAPANLTPAQVEAVMAARLHPFELAAPFRFVRRGGSVSIPRGKEAALKLVDVLPVVPPWGLPTNAVVWGMQPAPGSIVVPRGQKAGQPPSTPLSPAGGLCEALVVLFVAQGDFGDEMHSEKVVVERLHMQAVSYGRQANPKTLATFLHKWNANVKDLLGRSLLQEHSLEGNGQVVKYLLGLAYVRVGDGDHRGDTALHLAVWKGHLDIVTALLVANANPLQQNNLGQTSLHVALLSCQDTILDVLCKRLQQQQVPREALAALKDSTGLSPLGLFHRLSPAALHLCSEGAVDALRALCGHFLYDRRRLFAAGQRDLPLPHLPLPHLPLPHLPVHEAAANGHADMVHYLLEELRLPAGGLDASKRTPLHHAARNGHTAVVKRLLQANADPNALDSTGRSPFLLALHFRRFETAEYILDTCPHQALDTMDRSGLGALHVASACGALRLVQLLLDRNASLVDLRHVVSGSVRRSAGATPVPNARTDPVAYLRFRRQVNQRYGRLGRRRRAPRRALVTVPFQFLGPSPLWCAVHGASEGSVAILLSRGAGRSGDDTPAFLASLMTRLLQDRNYDCASAVVKLIGPAATAELAVLAHFIEARDAVTTRWLCDRRVGTDGLTSRSANAPLCVAARIGDAAAVKYLLSVGALAACGPAAASPLLLAARHGHDAVVQELILSGYRPSAGDEATSPLVVAARCGREAMVKGLVGLAPPSTFDAVTALMAALAAPPPKAQAQAATWHATLEAVCCVLLRYVSELDSHVHPFELLHTLAAHALWAAVETLCGRLLLLSPDQRQALVASAPVVAARPTELISPAVSSRTKQNKRGRKALFPKPVPFARFLPSPAGRGLPGAIAKQKVRDCVSFLAEARRFGLAEALVCQVGVVPSAHADVTGTNAADYAVQTRHYDMLLLLLAANVVPQPAAVRSGPQLVGLGKLRTVVEACRSSRFPALPGMPPFVRVACGLAAAGAVDVLRDVCLARLRVAKALPQEMLRSVLQAAVGALQGPAVRLLLHEFHCDASVPLRTAPELGMTLVAAVLRRGVSASLEEALLVVHSLATRRCPLDAESSVPVLVARSVKRAVGVDVGAAKVSPSFVLAAHPPASRLLVELLLAARQAEPPAADGPRPASPHSPLLALVVAAPHFPPAVVDDRLAAAVAALATSGVVYASHGILRTAARKGLRATCSELIARYGAECIAADIAKASGGPSVLHYFARHPTFNGLLSDNLFAPSVAADEDDGAPQDGGPKVSLLMAKLATVTWEGPRGSPCDEALRAANVDAAALFIAANVFPAGPTVPGTTGLHRSAQQQLALAFARVAGLWARRRAPPDGTGYTMLHAAAELNAPLVLERLLSASSKAPQALPLAPYRDSVLALAARHSDPACAAAILRRQTSPVLRGLCTNQWMLYVLATGNGPMWSAMLGEYRGAAADVEAPLPCLTALEALPALRSRLVLPFCRAIVATATPLAMAVLCEDESAVRQLLAMGASAAGATSVLAALPSARLTMRSKFATSRRWLKSAAPEAMPMPAAVRARKVTKAPSPTFAATAIMLGVAVTPVLLATALMAATAHMATHAPGTAQQKLSGAAASYSRILATLLRAGGLASDRLTPADSTAVAIVLVVHRQWDLLQVLVEELLKLRRDLMDGDRFFAPLEGQGSPLLQRWVGTHTHPVHAAVQHGPREIIILVARHSHRQDMEGAKDREGRTAAYHAVCSASHVAFDTLSALQIPMNTVCDHKRRRTPLMVASASKRLVVVSQLLKLSDVVNQRDSAGNTALMLAAARGVQEVVELLLSAQADASLTNDSGLPAVFLAAMHGHDSIALPLCQHFTRTDGFTTRSGTALHFSAIGGCRRTTEFLVRTYDTLGVLQPDPSGHTPLYLAYCFGHDQVLRTLLSALQQRTEKPPTAVDDRLVMCSSTLRRFGWLRGVLALADVLHRETRKRGAPKLLTAPGEQVLAPVTPRLRTHKSLLLWCARANNAVGVRVCADHNMMDDCYALHTAAQRGAIDVVQLLVTLDMSDPNAPNAKGQLALDLALQHSKESVAVFLVQRMRVNLALLKPLADTASSAQNIFHRVCSSAVGASVLPIIVTRLTNLSLAGTGGGKENNPSGSGNYDPTVLSVLEALQQTDATGLTPFESAISVGSPALVLRIAQALQVLGTAAGQEVAVALSASLLAALPSLTPAIRVVLYDLFNVTEVASTIGFGRPAAGAQRLTFADVRMLGVAALRRDAFCVSKLEGVFTVEHERNVLKHLTQLLDVPFRLKFKPEALRGLTPAEQVDVLMRIGTTAILGKYIGIVEEKLFQVGSLELELGQSRTDVKVDVVGSTVTERFFVASGRGACVMAPNVSVILQKLMGSKVREAKLGADAVAKAVALDIRGLGHPLLHGFKLSVDWNGFTCPKAASDASLDSITSVSLREAQTRHVSESACATLLGPKGLGYIRRVFASRLQDVLAGTSLDELRAVASTATLQQPPTVTFVYRKQGPLAVTRGGAGPLDVAVEFSDTSVAPLDAAVAPIVTAVLRDTVLVQIHHLRDRFVQRVLSSVGKTRMGGDVLKFKLDVEGSAVEDIPPHKLSELLDDAALSLEAIFQHTVAPAVGGQLRSSQLTSANIVAQSISTGLRAVFVLFSSRREPLARRSGNKLMLCFSKDLCPTRACIHTALVADTARLESDTLREKLPLLVDDMQQRLHTYLPSSTLVLDAPSFTQLGDDENSCAALALLFHSRSELVLQAVVQGISVGWDTRLGAVVRKCVRQVTLVLEASAEATLTLLPNGNLVYFCPMLCVQNHAQHAWSLLTAPQIASLMLIQLLEMQPEVMQLIETSRPFACWCAVQGHNTRRVTAGATRGLFHVTTKSIVNRKAACNADEPLEFRGRLSSIRVTQQPAAGQPTRPAKKAVPSTLRVHFAAPTRTGTVPLQVRLHGHHISGSPMRILVEPGPAHIAATTVLSAFNTVVQGKPFDVELQLRDAFGNAVRRRAAKAAQLAVEGPPANNADGVTVKSWTEARPGVVRVTVEAAKPVQRCTIPIRLTTAGGNVVVPISVEVVTPDTRRQLRAARSTQPTRVALFFRSAIRRSEKERQQRDLRLLGGLRARKFPTGH